MTDNENRLLDQIALVYSRWSFGRDHRFDRALNGLFEIAKDIDEEGMANAFENGVRRAKEQAA